MVVNLTKLVSLARRSSVLKLLKEKNPLTKISRHPQKTVIDSKNVCMLSNLYFTCPSRTFWDEKYSDRFLTFLLFEEFEYKVVGHPAKTLGNIGKAAFYFSLETIWIGKKTWKCSLRIVKTRINNINLLRVISLSQ